jgi:CHAT domain-containing protein
MLGFYRRMWLDGADKVTALRAAKLEMLQAARASGYGAGTPGAWGAFILDGR